MQGNRNSLPLGVFLIGLLVFDAFFSSCCMKELGDGFCKHNTSNDPFSRCIMGYRKELKITEYSLTTSTKVNYKTQRERNLYLVLRLRGDTELGTKWKA